MKLKSLLIGSLLMALATTSMAQVTLTQTTTSDFMKGTGQNVVIADDNVSLQSKMTALYDYEATTNLPQELMDHQIVTWQNYLFCVGGFNGSSRVKTVYRASQETTGTSSWTSLNALPVALSEMAVVAAQSNLFVMGGISNNGVSNKIYVASISLSDASLGTWSESEFTLPQPLKGARAVAVHDNIYLMGGTTDDTIATASNKVYCLKLNSRGNIASISEVTSLPEARYGHAVVTYDSKIYVTGGQDATGTLKNTVYRATVNLNGTLGSWQAQTALPMTITKHAAVCANGILAVIGGMEEELPSTKLYYTYMDQTQLSWTLSSVVLPARTYSGASFAFGDKIFFTGGQNLAGSIVNFVRYAPVATGDAKVGSANFVSKPIDIGYPMKNIQQLSYNIAQGENTSYELLYRMADSTMVFGNWISAGTNNPATINQTKRAIQYMVRMTATGTENLQLQDMSVTMTGYTQLAGNLNSIGVLSVENSPYWATADITFTSGVHSVEPGVVIYFSYNTKLDITTACVNFNGTEEAPILLTYFNNDQRLWRGVYFTGSNNNTQNGGVYSGNYSSMSYTIVENGGAWGTYGNINLTYASHTSFSHCILRNSNNRGFYMSYSSPNISDCSIHDNNTFGMYLINSSSPAVVNTTMTGNTTGAYIFSSSAPAFTNSVATGNTYGIYSWADRDYSYNENTLYIHDNTYDVRVGYGTISADHTWDYYSTGYWISDGDLTIQASSCPTLTIAPGNIIRLDAGKYIYVGSTNSNSTGGGIYAVGNETDSITFTAKDSSWGGFYFRDASDYNSSSSLRYCIVEKGSTNIYCYKTTQPQLMYNTVRNPSGNVNIYLDYSEINMDECHLYGGTNGVFMEHNSIATMVMSTFEDLWACVRHGDNTCTSNFFTCTMRDSNQGIRYNTPNVTIPTYINRVSFDNVTSHVGIAEGQVSADQTWLTNEYGILGKVSVYYGSTSSRLTIEAGSILRFAESTGLGISVYKSGDGWGWGSSTMKGELYAEGTEESPIIFTALNGEIGGWDGLYFGPFSDYSTDQVSLLKHCIIEKATTNVYLSSTNQPTIENCRIRYASGRGVTFYNSSPVVSDCEIYNNGSYGVYVDYNNNTGADLVEVTGCNFHNNGNYGLYFRYPMSVGNVLNGLQFSNNNLDGIGVGEGQISVNRTWPANEYHILGKVSVYYGSTSTSSRLTIEAGSILRFAESTGLGISVYKSGDGWGWGSSAMKGELYAEGTEESPIIFTALNGGIGGWEGLYFGAYSDYSTNQVSLLKHCIIEKATTNVYLNNTNQPTIENCKIRYASGTGVYLYYSAPTIILSRIHNNDGRGIYLDGSSSSSAPTIGNTTFTGNDIVNNGTGAIYQNGSFNVNMAYNFLGIVDSLDIENNLVYDKLDNSNKGRVNVFPVSMLPISGNVAEGTMLYDGNPEYTMEGSTVMVKNFADSLLYQTTTDASGHFSIDSMSVTGAKKIEITPNVDVEATITTADALAVMLHFVHESMLSGCRLAAADVNRSFTVNSTDALLIQKRYVNQIQTFPNGDVYYHLYDTVSYTYDTVNVAVTALSYGDVNGSYHALNRGGVSLLTEGQMLIGSDQLVNIPVRIKNNLEAGAISLKLAYSAEYLSIEAVTLSNGEEVMLYDNEGLLTISWYNINPMYLSSNELLLTLTVRIGNVDNLNNTLQFDLDDHSEIADGNAIILNGVNLAMPELVTLGTVGLDEQGEGFALSLYPNPMKDYGIVRYELPYEGRVSFAIYDLLGNAVMTMEEGGMTAGLHEIAIKDLASGVYVGRLVLTGNHEEVKIVKIVVE